MTKIIDWLAPVGGTDALLRCIPGLRADRVRQWQCRDRVVRRGTGTGRAMIWHAEDVLELTLRFEMVRLGALPEKTATVWLLAKARLLARMYPSPQNSAPRVLLLAADPATGEVVSRWATEGGDDDGLDRPGAPATLVCIRIDAMIDQVAERIAKVAPEAVCGVSVS
jgi:hypothetical protein